jgi:hypothetical protein
VAKEIIGLDVNEEGVSAAWRAGYSAQAVDLSDPDATRDLSISGEVVVAGELIEHVESPGSFLEALHPLLEAGGRLIITTPNASALSSPLLAMTSREYVNADHIAIYSWYTLTNLVSRHDWDVSWVGTYRRPRSTSLLGRLAFAPENLLAEGWPFIAGGLIVVCQSGRANRRGSAETTVG